MIGSSSAGGPLFSFSYESSDDYFSISFDDEVRALSSAVLGGGLGNIRSFVNMRVGENFLGGRSDFPPPAQTLSDFADGLALEPPTAAMMTAASMKSFCFSAVHYGSDEGCSPAGRNDEISVYCLLSSGLSNALAAGDEGQFLPGEFFRSAGTGRVGTINIVCGTNVPMTDAALFEASMICTEAKTALLHSLGESSRLSGRPATGTGTDSLLVFCPPPGRDCAAENYCGKHTKLGELFGRAVTDALQPSLSLSSAV